MHTVNDLILNIAGGARAAHAFACEGRAGEDRRTFIRDLAAGLLCTAPDGIRRPCGRCPSCMQIAAASSMDVVVMSRSTGSSKTGRETYRVEDASAFIERLSMGSYGRYLIGIIDDADDLSETIQNKLLKTLEEPSPDTLIILGVSNRDNLLDTVQSRLSFIRVSDYEGYDADDDDGENGNNDAKLAAALETIVPMYTVRTSAYHEVRNALDKGIRSREDALSLIDAIEDEFRQAMISAGMGETAYDPAAYARGIELINTARMDIRRDMQHGKALRRLYLDLSEV